MTQTNIDRIAASTGAHPLLIARILQYPDASAASLAEMADCREEIVEAIREAAAARTAGDDAMRHDITHPPYRRRTDDTIERLR